MSCSGYFWLLLTTSNRFRPLFQLFPTASDQFRPCSGYFRLLPTSFDHFRPLFRLFPTSFDQFRPCSSYFRLLPTSSDRFRPLFRLFATASDQLRPLPTPVPAISDCFRPVPTTSDPCSGHFWLVPVTSTPFRLLINTWHQYLHISSLQLLWNVLHVEKLTFPNNYSASNFTIYLTVSPIQNKGPNN